MSTYWDLVCVEHDERLGLWWNHGEDRLVQFASTLPAWAAMDDARRGVSTAEMIWLALLPWMILAVIWASRNR